MVVFLSKYPYMLFFYFLSRFTEKKYYLLFLIYKQLNVEKKFEKTSIYG